MAVCSTIWRGKEGRWQVLPARADHQPGARKLHGARLNRRRAQAHARAARGGREEPLLGVGWIRLDPHTALYSLAALSSRSDNHTVVVPLQGHTVYENKQTATEILNALAFSSFTQSDDLFRLLLLPLLLLVSLREHAEPPRVTRPHDRDREK